jgi:hypothetical protein
LILRLQVSDFSFGSIEARWQADEIASAAKPGVMVE